MSNEIQNKHNVTFGKDYWTDSSVDDALRKIDASKKDGISDKEIMDLLASGKDYGQISEREYSQIRRYIQANYDRLSPEARAVFEKFDAAMQAAGGAGTAGKHHGTGDKVVMEGGKLDTLMKELEGMGKHHGADAPAHPQPPAPPPPPPAPAPTPTQNTGGSGSTTGAGSAGGTRPIGNSWAAILSAILSMLSEKEQALKEKGKQITGGNGGEAAKGPSEQQKLQEFQMELQDLQRMFQLVSNIATSLHETAKNTIGQIRG